MSDLPETVAEEAEVEYKDLTNTYVISFLQNAIAWLSRLAPGTQVRVNKLAIDIDLIDPDEQK